MKVLLDTHTLLWWLSADPALPPIAAQVIADPDTVVAVSAASAWEIAIKKAIGRLDAPDDLPEVLRANNFDDLPITVAHALAAGALPAHHADPFDRMLIAQARLESLTLITTRGRFSDYEVPLLPLG
jgi:PIN domain nuclease of toxin-antitoxin system